MELCRCPAARKALRSNHASNLPKCSNFFPFTLAVPYVLLFYPLYWQFGLFALCIASLVTFMNFARETGRTVSETVRGIDIGFCISLEFFPMKFPLFFIPLTLGIGGAGPLFLLEGGKQKNTEIHRYSLVTCNNLTGSYPR